jgi:hypothetical protein
MVLETKSPSLISRGLIILSVWDRTVELYSKLCSLVDFPEFAHARVIFHPLALVVPEGVNALR